MLWLVAVPLVLFAAAVVVWQLLSGQPTFRYKMTVEVITPEGLRTGSAVREVRFSKTANGGYYGQAVGEAVVLDLPNGGTLFALLTGEDGQSDHAGHLIWHIIRQVDDDVIELWPTAPETSSPRIDYPAPMLVTFDDLNDPTSVKRVDPDDLAAAFGKGVSLKRITIQLTDENVTTGIEERLEWLDNLAAYRTDPTNRFTNTLPREISGLRRKQ